MDAWEGASVDRVHARAKAAGKNAAATTRRSTDEWPGDLSRPSRIVELQYMEPRGIFSFINVTIAHVTFIGAAK